MAYVPSLRNQQLFTDAHNLVHGTYGRPMPADMYQLPQMSPQFSASDSSYRGGFRSQGMNAQRYLETLSEIRGYVAPQRMKGEYKDHERSGSSLNVPSVPLSNLRGLR